MVSSKSLNLIALGFFLIVITVVFWQIETDLKKQGIASGGPYDNAASYPRAIAVFMGVFLILQFAVELFKGKAVPFTDRVEAKDSGRAGMMLAVFGVYLLTMTTVGYHLATTPMIFAIMWICGMRQYLKMALASMAIATGFAFTFEVFLNVVLPLGIWDIFIPW